MKLVIDAQIIKAYFMESVLEVDHEMTESPTMIIDRICVHHFDQVFLDTGKQIETEWRNSLNNEWFDSWLAQLFRDGCAYEMDVDTCHATKSRLENLGFPRGSRDIWYIRTAKAIVEPNGNRNNISVFLISEDLDFYDPRQKNSARGDARLRVLRSSRSPVAHYLERNELISVRCIQAYMNGCNI